MKTISLDTKTMIPWHDINRLLSNVKSLKVKAGGRTYEGNATLEDRDGHLTLTYEQATPKSTLVSKVKSKVKRGVKE